MFKNVPDWLAERVRRISETVAPSDRDQVYLNAAGWTIAQYLHIDISKAERDSFFQNRTIGDTGSLWHGTVNRAILVGESLFLLRSSPGFSEFCRRMRGRDLRSAFFELLAAKQFFRAGYEIHARPEIGIKREDFDFAAVRDDETVNVEVTAFTADVFSPNTVLNALRKKRDQVPDTAPAVIYCVIPEHWLVASVDWDASLRDITNQFFSGTKRINTVVFWAEQHTDGKDGQSGAWMLSRKPYSNLNRRIPMKHSEFLFGGMQSEAVQAAVKNGEGLDVLVKVSCETEFFHWVDHLVPASKVDA